MQGTVPSRADAPAAMLMATAFLALGLFALLRPERLRSAMDRFAATWKKDSWHPYKMPMPILRLTAGSVGIFGAALFFYIGYLALTQ